jgi:hypothetical protein
MRTFIVESLLVGGHDERSGDQPELHELGVAVMRTSGSGVAGV